MSTNPARSSSVLGMVLVVPAAFGIGGACNSNPRRLDVASARPPTASSALVARVEAYRTTWNSHDPSALAEFFARDADMIMGNGPEARGRQAIQSWWRDYFATQEPERRVTVVVNSVRLIAADVAVIDIATTTGGRIDQDQALPDRKARGTWVLVRHGGEWIICAMRGMPTEQDRVVLVKSLALVGPVVPPDVPADLRAFVEAYQNAYNSNEPSALSALYTRDADIIVRNLPATRGWQAIQDWWRVYFANRTPRGTFSIDVVRLITADVALIDIRAGGPRRNAEGHEVPARQARGTWVLVRKANRWLLTALRVLPSEQDRIVRGDGH